MLFYPVQYWADTTTVDSTSFLQFGAVGLIAAIAMAAVRVLYKREVAEHEREKARADRLEAELAKLNAMIQNQYMNSLTEAQRAVTDAISKVNQQRRERER